MEVERRERIKRGRRGGGKFAGGFTTQTGIIVGVATVAGLGLVGKLLSVWRRKPNNKSEDEPKDAEIEALEAVVNGDPTKTKNLSLQAQVQKAKLANLDNDEPIPPVLANGANIAGEGEGPSEFVDAFSEEVHDDDVPEEGEIFVTQEPAGGGGGHNKSGHKPDVIASVGFQRKGDQFQRKTGVNIKGMPSLNSENDGSSNHSEPGSERRSRKDSASTSENLGAVSSSTQKKSRRVASGSLKSGRKSKSGGSDKNFDPLQKKTSKSIQEGGNDVVGNVPNSSSKWDSVNGYKVLRAASSGIDPALEDAVKESRSSLKAKHPKENHQQEVDVGEAKKAQDLWDGKHHHDHRRIAEGEHAEASLRIVSSVISSISEAEETDEGVRVHEIVRRSTLLPVPAGNDASVHSSVYNVKETNEGLKIEEVVKRTKLLPPLAEGDFAHSDRQLLTAKKKKPSSLMRMLPFVLRVVAVLIALLSILIVLLSRRRISLPHLSFFY